MENFKFSYSSCNTFKSCPYAFDLLYNQRVDRTNNYYGQFGSVMHEVMEDLLLGKVDIYELEDLYNAKYDRRRQWSRAANVWHNAGIRSGLHMAGTPIRMLRRLTRRRREA